MGSEGDRVVTHVSVPAGLLASAVVAGTLAVAATLQGADPDRYYRLVQEDEALEWITFWAFLLAGAVQAVLGLRAMSTGWRWAWFPLGLSLFCGFVAMEEISWGQRIVGYRPPVYFLEHNFQQELNLHNIVDSAGRKLALQAVILGYGIALPLLMILPWPRRFALRAGVVAPPAELAPVFAAAFVLYVRYPWNFSGEWVELLLGLGFLFAAALAAGAGRSSPAILIAVLLAAGLGAASTAATRAERATRPELVAAARAEAEALRNDFIAGRAAARCQVHKRLYTYVEEYGQRGLLEGEFAGLVSQGLPEERARYFLDPWNSPYWLRDACSGKRRVTSVYSFGPNRRRDSTRWSIGGDDIGVVLLETPADPATEAAAEPGMR